MLLGILSREIPAVSGISLGLIQGHKFIKKNEGKTCAFCHGGRYTLNIPVNTAAPPIFTTRRV